MSVTTEDYHRMHLNKGTITLLDQFSRYIQSTMGEDGLIDIESLTFQHFQLIENAGK
jgi:hypothetical protein